MNNEFLKEKIQNTYPSAYDKIISNLITKKNTFFYYRRFIIFKKFSVIRRGENLFSKYFFPITSLCC